MSDSEIINDKDSSRPSRLLVWPKTMQGRRRRRQKQHQQQIIIQEKGWVLGWTSSTSSSNKNSNTYGSHRETFVCAGILDSSKRSRSEYEKILNTLKSTSSRAKSCDCLIGSLEIIAHWSAKKPNRAITNDNLPMITNERRYPWFEEEETIDGHKQQLLYYNQYQGNDLAHLASEYGNDRTDWSLLLHRINHSKEILDIVQSGEMIPRQSPVYDKHTSQSQQNNNNNNNNNQEINNNDEKETGIIRRFQNILYTQSLTLQHFDQVITSNRSLFHSIAAFRCGSNMQKAFFASKACHQDLPCSHCKGRCCIIPSRSIMSKLYIEECNQFWSSLFDMLFGLLVGLVLYYTWKYIPNLGLKHLAFKKSILHNRLLERVKWLEKFPAGFKLNVKLTSNLGYEIRNILHLHERLLSATTWNLQFCQDLLIPLGVASNVLFGWSGFLAIFIDLTRYELTHAMLLASCFRNLYRVEWYLLSALWRLFRGKKRNRLRKRTDSMQYDAMQLLVGTIVFCICIFLWTTIFVYYTFFMVWNVLMHLLFVIGIFTLYTINLSIPWASLWFRTTRINWFTTNVSVRLLLQNDHLSITRFGAQNLAHSKIFLQSLWLNLKPLSTWLISFVLEVILPRSSNPAPCSMPLVTLLEGFCTKSR